MPGQNRLSNAAGGYFSVPKLSKKLRSVAQPLMRYRGFTTKESDFGKREGDTLYFNKIGNLDADTSDGAIIAEGAKIPRAKFATTRGTCVARPSGRSVPWTEEYEVLSTPDVRSPIQSRLVDHMAKSLDRLAYNQFNATKVIYTPTGTTADAEGTWDTDGTVSTAATRDIQVYDLKEIIDGMKAGSYGGTASAPVPPWDGVNYQAIGSVGFCRALKDDPEWEKAQYYGDPEKLFSGECGRIYGCRTVEDNHILGNIGGFKGGAFVFGEDAVMEMIVTPEEIRVDIPQDFGRDMAMAWYYLGGFKVIWEFTSTGAFDTDELDNRIVAVKST